MVIHFVFFVVSIAVLLSQAQRSSNQYVWTTLTTGVSGWNNAGVCFGLGLLTATYGVAGRYSVKLNFASLESVSC